MQETENYHFIQSQTTHPIHGKLADLLLPCGTKVTIREQNGNDDDVISSPGSDKDLSLPLNKFIAGLILKHDFNFKSKEVITMKEVLDIPLRSKYFILLASRIFSISPTIKFRWDWKNGKPPVAYEEDLTVYLWDYNRDFPSEMDPDYFSERIQPYPPSNFDKYRELELSSGKKIRYKYLDGHGENYLLGLSENERAINSPLKARELNIWLEGDWSPVTNFKDFKNYEMSEIRRDIDINDKPFDGFTNITNPYNGEALQIPLLSIPDFFFPREI